MLQEFANDEIIFLNMISIKPQLFLHLNMGLININMLL
jgi:hypothetical protein